jgi:hypothetical protein
LKILEAVKSLADASPSGVMITNGHADAGPSGPRIGYVNAAFEILTCHNAPDCIGRPVAMMCFVDVRGNGIPAHEFADGGGRWRNAAIGVTRKHGGVVPISLDVAWFPPESAFGEMGLWVLMAVGA